MQHNVITSPHAITNAGDFEAFMASVWDAPCAPQIGGGLVMYASPGYDEWGNAWNAIRATEALRMAPTTINTARAAMWAFRDGSRIAITNDGSCIRIPSRAPAL